MVVYPAWSLLKLLSFMLKSNLDHYAVPKRPLFAERSAISVLKAQNRSNYVRAVHLGLVILGYFV